MLFQSPFHLEEYTRTILSGLLHAQRINARPELLEETSDGDVVYGLGILEDADRQRIGLFYTDVRRGDVTRKRVGLRRIVEPYIKTNVDAALAVFDDGRRWRLSYICDFKEGSTSAKRFSYILGDENGQYKTPLERLEKVANLNGRLKLSDLRESFSVDALSDEFFDEYHHHYDNICGWIESNAEKFSIFNSQFSILHDYVKKMMGRIVFLHFLQKKGWLCGDPNFMQNTFRNCNHQDDYLESVLEPLFFGMLNTEPHNREAIFRNNHWDIELLHQWQPAHNNSSLLISNSSLNSIPYLNGGLFEEDDIDKLRVTLPARIFKMLFDFLASYNFTVDENDPDDAEIGVDPEMLGKIFESLLEDNKAKGAFYTPKEIVRYMCKESLIAYLGAICVPADAKEENICFPADAKEENICVPADGKSSDCGDAVGSLIRTFVETHEFPDELEPCRDVLDRALREVKICDPAIGSGAFPMGLLNELWRCRESIRNDDRVGKNSRLQLKKEIIENNIYGVDIERGAIDIARLRFWLSIVVDSDEPAPLPNFDYKFMQGNSLIESFEGVDLSRMMSSDGQHSGLGKGRQKAGANQLAMEYSTDDTKRNLQLMLKEYFSLTDHGKKAEARRSINDSVKRYIRQQGLHPSAEARLSALDPSANQEFFLWHTWFKDIFDKGGFDIVVGNPPYVVVAADGTYGSYKTSSCLDLYAFFYERAVNLLNKNGILSFITSSLFVKGLKFGALREFLQNSVSVVAFRIEGDDVFKNAEVPTATFIARKSKSIWRFEDFYADGKLTDKITRGAVPLSSISSIMRGFEIGRKMVNSAGQHKFLTGSDVSKYHYTKLSYISQYVLEAFLKDKKYFSKERILLRETGSFLMAVYIGDETIYSNRSLYSILITNAAMSTKYVLALLNSSLLQWYYLTMFKSDTELFPKIRIAQAKQLPILRVSVEQQQPIIALIDQILDAKKSNPSANTSVLEREIDMLVYGLYGLTEEEIAAIEKGV